MAATAENLALNPLDQKAFNELVKDLDPTGEKEPVGTIYIGHLPHGFYEKELREYFSQFGIVNKVRLARSKKTGGYKGYGYLQFASKEVARIAAEAMNNYLMFDKILRCEFVPEETLHPKLWKNCNKKFVWLDKRALMIKLHNKEKTKDELKKMSERLVHRDDKRREKLAALGINYEFSGYADAIIKDKKRKQLLKKIKTEKKLKEKSSE